MPLTASDLVALFDLETETPERFIGRSPANGWKRVFGGQVVAQALVAAERTVEGRPPHSLHAYFLLGGDPLEPIRYEVERIRDGRSFTTRRVLAKQRSEVIFMMSASFQVEEAGIDDHVAMLEAPAPEDLADSSELMRAAGARPESVAAFEERVRPIELRPLDADRYRPGQGDLGDPRRLSAWIRIAGRLPDDPAIHRAALAYLSDMTPVESVFLARGQSIASGKFIAASLDHALWFHRPCRADDWLLYQQDSPNAYGARGLSRGLFFTRDGKLAADVAQEAMIRPRTPR